MEWSRACNALTTSQHWQVIKDTLAKQQEAVGLELVTMKVKPDQMQIVAERMKSRADYLSEIEGSGALFNKREEEYETLLKSFNSRH